ncbi:MAG TPA: hypothetical protein VFQ91_27400 [Bryobacteraceae bacterium]|nr:hypothetical protein [Bryobacteraceae bacterium]
MTTSLDKAYFQKPRIVELLVDGCWAVSCTSAGTRYVHRFESPVFHAELLPIHKYDFCMGEFLFVGNDHCLTNFAWPQGAPAQSVKDSVLCAAEYQLASWEAWRKAEIPDSLRAEQVQ